MNEEILKQLKILNKIMFQGLSKDWEQIDKISFLYEGGLNANEIAELINSNTNVVSVTINRLKNKENGKVKKSAKPTKN